MVIRIASGLLISSYNLEILKGDENDTSVKAKFSGLEIVAANEPLHQ